MPESYEEMKERLYNQRGEALERWQDKYAWLQKLVEPLVEIAERMVGQDNRATGHPIFVVEQKRRVYGVDPDYTDSFVYVMDGEEVASTKEELQDFLKEQGYSEFYAYENSLQKIGYTNIWEFVQPFFSEKAANDYIEANRHNLKDPRVFVASAYRNKEWQAVREILKAFETPLMGGEK